jgi:hypothetical protein
MVKKISQTVAVILFCALAIRAQTITAKAYVDSSSYAIGDYINLTVNVVHDKDISLSSPVVGDSTSDFDVIDSKPPVVQKKGNEFSTTYQFTLSKYDSGEVSIHIPIYYTLKGDTTIKVAYTNPVSFVVKTLKVDLQKPIKDVKKPIKIPLNWKLIILIVLIILLILATAYYFYKKYKKKKQPQVVAKKIISRPPHVTALYELRALEEKQLWQKGMIKEYHTAITEIIRKYFHYQFFLPAMELTTTEVMDYLKKVEDAKPILDITLNFLSNADLVKFAKFKPMDSINEEMMKQAVAIVEKTKPKQTKELVSEDRNV